MIDIWSQVEKTDKKDTKEVTFGRKFTAICAYSQIKKATEIFGPVGIGWGWDFEIVQDNDIWIFKVTLWHGEEKNKVVSFGCNDKMFKPKNAPAKPDDDAPKKALTDGITKALSYLGFNADVFLGDFEKNDNKYTNQPKNVATPKSKPKPETKPKPPELKDYQQTAVDKLLSFFKGNRLDAKSYLNNMGFPLSHELSSEQCDMIVNDINSKDAK